MKVQGFVIEFIISAVLVLVVFGAAADEEASFAYHSCFIIFAHNLDGKLSLPDSVPNVHSCFTKMVWWRYLKQLSTCFNCHRHPPADAYTHTGQQGCTWFSATCNRTCHHYLPSFCCKYCHCHLSFIIKLAFITTFKTISILIAITACHLFAVSIVTCHYSYASIIGVIRFL